MERIRTAADASRWLSGLIDVEKLADRSRARFGLGPIGALLARVGNPERRLRPIHVAGSKGKGSVALLCEALLRGAGLRVGTFTSPHLERWTERFRLDGAEVAGERLAGAVERLRPHVEAVRRDAPADAPTWFDVTTAAALLLFAEAELDAVVLEVGLGGRLDSTNVVQPALACVTGIELEHTEVLGTTLAAVAAEKAGILKPGAPVVIGALAPEARDVVCERARALGCPLAELGVDFAAELRGQGPGGLEIRLADGEARVETRLATLGDVQAGNAAIALACALRAGVAPRDAVLAGAARSLARASLPGRLELLGERPLRLVDAAHTEASARAFARALARLAPAHTHLVLSISTGKSLETLCRIFSEGASRVTLTRADPKKSLPPADVARALRAVAPRLPVRVVPNPHLALRAALEGARPDGCVAATGSVYLAGIARRVLPGAPGPVVVSRRRPGRSADGG